MLTQARLRELLHYDPETGVFTWLVARGNAKNGDAAGSAGRSRKVHYLFIGIDNKVYRCHRLAWLYMTGEWPLQVDHINGNGTDNKWSNLRIATTSQNKANMEKRVDNTSGYKGVSWYKLTNRWVAQIGFRGKRKTIGYFNTAEEAHAAYRAEAEQLFGEFARV